MTLRPLILLFSLVIPSTWALGELHFPTLVKEVKVPPEKDAISIEFPFTNTSGKNIKLGKIKPSCECTTASYEGNKKTLASGESCKILAVMKTGNFTGMTEKKITVHTEAGAYTLSIHAYIPDIVRLNPSQLAWMQGDATEPKTITIVIDSGYPIKLKEVSLSGKNFDFEPKTLLPGKKYQVTITPKSTEKACFESVRLLTDSPLPRYSKALGFISVNPQP